VEEIVQSQGIALVGMDTGTLLMYAATAKIGNGMHDSLKHAAELQQLVIDTQRKRAVDEQEINSITQEQNRIRENMNALDRNSDLYKRLVKKLDEQETRIEALRNDIADLRKQEDTQRKEYETYVNGLDLTQDL